jgi:putative ABC transport system substrate-binding protein
MVAAPMPIRRSMPLFVFLALLAVAGLSRRAVAEGTATIAGTVCDARGIAIEGARVTLKPARGGPTITSTDVHGAFRFAAQRASAFYSVMVEQPGFRSVQYDGFRLESNRTRQVDVRLKRPGDRDVAVFLSRDPFPFQDLAKGLVEDLAVPSRIFDLDADPHPEETVRRVQAEHPDLILGAGLLASHLVHREVRDIPAILTLVSDPRRYDLEAANLCFVATNPAPEELIRRVKAFLPRARSLGIVYDARASALIARDIHSAARQAGFVVLERPCYSPDTLEQTLDSLDGRIDVLAVPFDPLTVEPAALDIVTGWALRHRVPLAAPGPEWVKRGALFSYGATPETIGRDVSLMATQILAGLREPSDFPLRAPTAPFLAFNLNTALAFGLALPEGFVPDVTY